MQNNFTKMAACDKSKEKKELADADDGHKTATLRAFLAVAEEEVAAAGGAEIAHEDIGGAEACG